LFSVLNIPDHDFKNDLARFRKLHFSGIDWDQDGQAMIKVYFGLFPMGKKFDSLSEALTKQELLCYDHLRKKGLLPANFLFCVRYSQKGRSLRTDLRCRTRQILPYLKMLDPKKDVSRFFVDLYRIFPGLSLQYISLQWAPVQKRQFYFLVGRRLGKP
jgi:hypothetical protein